jgi:hypothetical protein
MVEFDIVDVPLIELELIELALLAPLELNVFVVLFDVGPPHAAAKAAKKVSAISFFITFSVLSQRPGRSRPVAVSVGIAIGRIVSIRPV